MNLQVYENYTAKRSPCHNCSMLGVDHYPACADECADLNKYLVAIGDKPIAPTEKNLWQIYGDPQSKGKKHDRATDEEYYQALSKVETLLKQTGWQKVLLAYKIGVSEYTICNMVRGGQKGILKETYNKIMAFEWKPENES